MHIALSRTLGVAASVAALVGGALAAAPASSAAPEDTASRWLVQELDEGVMHNDQFDFDDYGLTADAGLALLEIGGAPGATYQVRKQLRNNVRAWTTFDGDVYAGSTAKALVFAVEAKGSPRRFGGLDLVRRTASLISTRPRLEGRLQDRSADGTDYANTIGQAFAVQGLKATGQRTGELGLRFLLKQQCDDGFFRLNFAPTDQRRQRCGAGKPAASAPDVDATALALLALHTISPQGKRVRGAIVAGTRWLRSEQRADGSFGGGPTTAASNTNSTGLAASALGQQGRCRDAAEAARWVQALQRADGAVAYDRTAYDAAENDGITPDTQDQWRRATAQAAPGLSYLDPAVCRGA